MTPSISSRDMRQDILKGLAIILVVAGHISRGIMENPTPNMDTLKFLDFLIYTTHMPLFFLIAGYNCAGSLQRKTRSEFLSSRLWALVYPYILWSFLFWLLKYVSGFVLTINHPITLADLMAIPWHPLSVLWFLYAMLVMQVAAASLKNHPRLLLGLSGVAMVASTLFSSSLSSLVFSIGVHLPFFAMGYTLAFAQRPLIASSLTGPGPLLLAVALFAGSIPLAYTMETIPPVSALMVPVSVAGILILAGLAERIKGYAATHLAMLGQASMAIYLLHIVLLPIVPRLLPKLGMYSDTITILAGTLLGVYGSIGAYRLLTRWGLSNLLGLRGRPPFQHPTIIRLASALKS